MKPKVTIEDLVQELSGSLMEFLENFPKIIIFCRRFEECAECYSAFKYRLGDYFTNPLASSPNLSKLRVVDMYTS